MNMLYKNRIRICFFL